MPEVDVSAGTIAYEDTGGDGPVFVPLHGLAMDGSLWRHVVADLRTECRCVVPTLPLGGHRRPMRPDADLSLRGMANLVGEFLERLDLHDVTLVMNDWGGAHLLVGEGRAVRIGKLAFVSCEAFDNFPPGLPGRMVALAATAPAAAPADDLGVDEQASGAGRGDGRLVEPLPHPARHPPRPPQVRAQRPAEA